MTPDSCGNLVLTALSVFWVAISNPALAVEGGYSNYLPGFYGDITLAVEPADGLSFRNDFYFYSAEGDATVRSGAIELEVEVDLTFNYLTFLYKPGVEVFGAQYAYGASLAVGKVDLSGEVAVGPFAESFSDDKTALGDMIVVPGVFTGTTPTSGISRSLFTWRFRSVITM